MLEPWVVFPLVLALLCAGSGLVVCRIARLKPEPCLLLPLGFAGIVVVSSFAVWVMDSYAARALAARSGR